MEADNETTTKTDIAMATIMSGLNQNETRLLIIHKFQVVFKAGQAVTEGATKTKVNLQMDILEHVRKLINDITNPNLIADKCSLPHVRDSKIELFLANLKSTYSNGASVWGKYKNMKSLIINHCN